MWPYKSISHIQVFSYLLFSNPTHKTGIATRWDWTTSCNPPGPIKLPNQSTCGVRVYNECLLPTSASWTKKCRARTILWWAKPACFDCSSSNYLEMGGYIYYGVEVLGCQGCLQSVWEVIISRWLVNVVVNIDVPNNKLSYNRSVMARLADQVKESQAFRNFKHHRLQIHKSKLFLFSSSLQFCFVGSSSWPFTPNSSPLSRGLLFHVNPRFFLYDSHHFMWATLLYQC